MKRLVFISCMLIYFYSSIIAQRPYIPVAQSGKFWYYEVFEDLGNFEWGEKILDRVLYCGEDTLVEGIKYHKLYHFTETPIDLEDMENHVIALLRDDTIERKTYLLPLDTTFKFCEQVEHLIFDFIPDLDLNCMDSCMIKRIAYFMPVVEANKGCIINWGEDTINGFYVPLGIRSYFTFNSTFFYEFEMFASEILIEGVGLSINHNGFFYDPYSRLIGYCEGTLEDCGLIVSTSDLRKDAPAISIQPNPVGYHLSVATSIDILGMSVIDMYGRELLKVNSHEADVSQLTAGIYFLRVFGKDIEYVRKFVKK